MRTLLTLLISSLCYLSTTALADEIEISIATTAAPKAALGIFFSAGKVVQQPNTSFERLTPEIVVVRMPYDFSGLPSPSSFATAYVLTEDDDIVFGDVRLVSAADNPESFWRTPICAADKSRTKVEMQLPEQLNYLESLLQVRAKKREVAQAQIKSQLTPELLSRLEKLEKGFGLSGSAPLSGDLSGLELVDRLGRIRNAIILYRQSRDASVSPTPAPQ